MYCVLVPVLMPVLVWVRVLGLLADLGCRVTWPFVVALDRVDSRLQQFLLFRIVVLLAGVSMLLLIVWCAFRHYEIARR